MAHRLPRRGEARRAHDCGQVVDGSCKVLIHNNIIKLDTVAHLFARGIEPGAG